MGKLKIFLYCHVTARYFDKSFTESIQQNIVALASTILTGFFFFFFFAVARTVVAMATLNFH